MLNHCETLGKHSAYANYRIAVGWKFNCCWDKLNIEVNFAPCITKVKISSRGVD